MQRCTQSRVQQIFRHDAFAFTQERVTKATRSISNVTLDAAQSMRLLGTFAKQRALLTSFYHSQSRKRTNKAKKEKLGNWA
jgi:hypothetical protein